MGLGLFKKLREMAGAGQDDIHDVVRLVCSSLGTSLPSQEQRSGAAAALAETLEELARRGVVDRNTVDACAHEIRALGDGKGA